MGLELLIIALLVPAVATKWVQDNRTDRAYAKKGMVSPRHQVRLARLEKAGRPVSPKSRGPLRNYMSELYADAMLDRVELHRQKRAHRGPVVYNPGAPKLRQRLGRAADGFDAAVLGGIRRVQESQGWDRAKAAARTAGRRLVDPVGDQPPTAGDQPAAVPAGLTDRKAGDVAGLPGETVSRRFDGQPETDADRRFFDLRDSGYRGWIDQDGHPVDGPTFQQTAPVDEQLPIETDTNTENEPSGGPTMTSTIGEASTYDTAVPALGDLQEAMANLSDHVAGAEASADEFRAHVEEIDEAKTQVAESAQLVQDQMAAAGVSGSSMDQVAAAMEMVQQGDLAAAMDFIGQARQQLSDAKTAATEAASAAGQAQEDLVSSLGDAHAQVAEQLSGNGEFLNSGGGGGHQAGTGWAYDADGGIAPAHLVEMAQRREADRAQMTPEERERADRWRAGGGSGGGGGTPPPSSGAGAQSNGGGSGGGGRVYTEPVVGAHFGDGNVYRNGQRDDSSNYGGTPSRSDGSNRFAGGVSNVRADTGDVNVEG